MLSIKKVLICFWRISFGKIFSVSHKGCKAAVIVSSYVPKNSITETKIMICTANLCGEIEEVVDDNLRIFNM